MFLFTFPTPTCSFGTVDSPKILKQHSEHERITRSALACKSKESSNGDCFEPLSIDELAGKEEKPTGFFGAVGAPDKLLDLTDPDSQEGRWAHCDDADFFSGPNYPQGRPMATLKLFECIRHFRGRAKQGIDAG